MRSFRFISIFLVIICMLAACSQKETAQSKEEQHNPETLTLAIGGEPEAGFDPTTGWGRYGSPLFQSTLLKRDQDLEITTDLAKDYQVSGDGLHWTVQLREDVVFSDGEELTAEDVSFTYETAMQAQSVVDLSNLKKIEVKSEDEVVFHLEKPQSTFITTLLTLGIVPKHAYGNDYAENPIGTGPYQMVEWRKGEQLIVEKNPNYYGEEPEFKRLTFLFIEEDQALAAAKTGIVDVLSVPATLAEQNISGMNRLSFKSVDNRGVMLPIPEPYENEAGERVGNEVTSDLYIRQAMNYAVDRQAIVDGVLNGEGTKSFSSVDGLPWGNEDAVVEYDVEKAKQLMQEGGWKKGTDGIYQKDEIKASFTLYYPTGDQLRQSLSLVFAEMMNEFGIEVKTEGKSWNDLEKVMHANPVMMGWGSHDPVELYYLFSSKMQGVEYYNSNYYANQTIDQYFQKAIQETSQEKANEYWKKIQWDGKTGVSAKGDAPWVWLVNIHHIYYVKEGLDIGDQKVQPHGHGWPITDFITEWKWKN